ncbi:MAG: NADP-dependent phosphogluconate dehydrogenase [Saprospiraceae bacterium]|nr:NADP-dependent phosphogluconate dehydrogenase [Saprospiraceae bacterium]
MARRIILMGVSGVGKTTIGKLLASGTSAMFVEGDDYHPPENIRKMTSGTPLEDEDRWPWLLALAKEIKRNPACVVACSALKKSYRTYLSKQTGEDLFFVQLVAGADQIQERMKSRAGHFMPPELLDSQFSSLEDLDNEPGIFVKNSGTPESVAEQIISTVPSEIGIVGLGPMGANLARNFAGKGYWTSIFNRESPPLEVDVASSLKEAHQELKTAKGFSDLPQFIQSLERPRKIFLMVKAGEVVDQYNAQILPHLDEGDIILDCGNSHYKDTQKRQAICESQGIHYYGVGVSGGLEGALKGPSIMPAGNKETFVSLEPILGSIAARDPQGKPCSAWIGKSGAGHFVKMVHNGIEYAEMQLLAELSSYYKYNKGLSNPDLAELFEEWSKGKNQSFLLAATARIFKQQTDGGYLVDQIVDQAAHKGTGAWTSQEALSYGVAVPALTAGVNARFQSQREFQIKTDGSTVKPESLPSDEEIHDAYFSARVLNHQQGLNLIRKADQENGWGVNLKELARIWTAGCIIRSGLMETLSKDPDSIQIDLASLKGVCLSFLEQDLYAPCFQANYQFSLGLTSENFMANLIQAQRDFFGAHGIVVTEDKAAGSFTFNWDK